jgi:hypothetical protein
VVPEVKIVVQSHQQFLPGKKNRTGSEQYSAKRNTEQGQYDAASDKKRKLILK